MKRSDRAAKPDEGFAEAARVLGGLAPAAAAVLAALLHADGPLPRGKLPGTATERDGAVGALAALGLAVVKKNRQRLDDRLDRVYAEEGLCAVLAGRLLRPVPGASPSLDAEGRPDLDTWAALRGGFVPEAEAVALGVEPGALPAALAFVDGGFSRVLVPGIPAAAEPLAPPAPPFVLAAYAAFLRACFRREVSVGADDMPRRRDLDAGIELAPEVLRDWHSFALAHRLLRREGDRVVPTAAGHAWLAAAYPAKRRALAACAPHLSKPVDVAALAGFRARRRAVPGDAETPSREAALRAAARDARVLLRAGLLRTRTVGPRVVAFEPLVEGAAAPPPPGAVLVAGSLEVHAWPDKLPAAALYALAACAELAPRGGRAGDAILVGRFTAESVFRGRTLGVGAAELLALVDAGGETPQSARFTLADWAGRTRAATSAVVRTLVADPAVLEELAHDPAFRPFLGERLAPERLLVHVGGAATEAGFLAVLEKHRVLLEYADDADDAEADGESEGS